MKETVADVNVQKIDGVDHLLYTTDYKRISTLDTFLELTQPTGSIQRAATNNLYGFNHSGAKAIIPDSKDNRGYVFFTRPMLNLSDGNIRNIPEFDRLLTKEPLSINRYVRCLLDPSLESKNIKSPLLDNQNPFIAVFTNNILSLSGFNDLVLGTYTSREGVRKEQWGMTDSHIDVYDSYDISCTFRNTKDEPILNLIEVWSRVQSYTHEGMMQPYLHFIINNEIDYNTRIYRVTMDETNRIVKRIAATGASHPTTVPLGKYFDYQDNENYISATRDINVNFKCYGATYNSPILIKEFNETGAIFNSHIRKMLNREAHGLIRIPHTHVDIFNYKGYPIINEDTLELEWWVNPADPEISRLLKMLGEKI